MSVLYARLALGLYHHVLLCPKIMSTTNSRLHLLLLPPFQKKYPVDFDDKLKIGDVRYDNMT